MHTTKNNYYLSCENCSVKNKSPFGSLCHHELLEVTGSKSIFTYKKGKILFSEGFWPQGVFCIEKGKVKVYKTGSDGKEMIVYICSGGDLLGYNALISDEPYSMAAEVIEDCVVCFIPKSDFQAGMDTSSQLRNSLLKLVCKQEGLLAGRITNLAQKTVRERLACTLMALRDIYIDEKGMIAEINLSREDLANMVGTATESLIRLLREFREEGLVEINGRRVKVLQEDVLSKIANMPIQKRSMVF